MPEFFKVLHFNYVKARIRSNDKLELPGTVYESVINNYMMNVSG